MENETWAERDDSTGLIEDNGKYVCPVCGRLKNKIDLGKAIINDEEYKLSDTDKRVTDLCNSCAESYEIVEILIPCHDGRTNKSIFK